MMTIHIHPCVSNYYTPQLPINKLNTSMLNKYWMILSIDAYINMNFKLHST